MTPTESECRALVEAWHTEYATAAVKEGWGIAEVDGASIYGMWHFERRAGKGSVTALWACVLRGTEPQHESAIQLLLKVNPKEVDYWCRQFHSAGLDMHSVPKHRVALVVAAVLTE